MYVDSSLGCGRPVSLLLHILFQGCSQRTATVISRSIKLCLCAVLLISINASNKSCIRVIFFSSLAHKIYDHDVLRSSLSYTINSKHISHLQSRSEEGGCMID